MVLHLVSLLMLVPTSSRHHYTCEYTTSNSKGEIQSSRTIEGNIETSDSLQTWSNVQLIQAGKAVAQEYMDGLKYDPNRKDLLSESGVFRAFPETAVEAKDIVSDVIELQGYAKSTKGLKEGIGEPSRPLKASDNAVRLTSLGSELLKGHRCHVVKFECLFKKVEFSVPGVHFIGRSHRWGEVWADAKTGVVVRATHYEDLLGDLTMGNAKDTITMNILRRGSLELK